MSVLFFPQFLIIHILTKICQIPEYLQIIFSLELKIEYRESESSWYFGGSKVIAFKSVRKNPKKVTEKREFLRKTSFRRNRFFYMVVIQKIITDYVSVKYIQLNFQKNLTFFEPLKHKPHFSPTTENYILG
ncbi:Uncharacterized protein FWK35_00025369 [Aphis craccivora]|uniref:Uncharacterized protein n=1 Tax=Aphis craccivora TaxID=307492 RepID=A0A6G0YQ15_APHCR|nr:Uncharacterized protein FWK35_00025369 [Aphis craccivora]